MNRDKLFAFCKKHEADKGPNLEAYKDSKGIWTIGYGHNLQTMKCTVIEAECWLSQDIALAQRAAAKFKEYIFLDTDARQNAFVELVFNMGPVKVAEFKKMLAAIAAQDWQKAADELYNSKWREDVGPNRSKTLIDMIRTGNFPA